MGWSFIKSQEGVTVEFETCVHCPKGEGFADGEDYKKNLYIMYMMCYDVREIICLHKISIFSKITSELSNVFTLRFGGNAPINVFPRWIPWGLDCQNSHCPREFERRLWHRTETLDVSARKSRRNYA